LDKSVAKNVVFILVATPVEEIGRDHDFDWGVIEPSSYRSIIQLAGRVRRHREGAIDYPNIALLQFNWRAIKGGNQADEKYFCQPGYEDKQRLATHDLCELINTQAITHAINSIPRIQKPKQLNYQQSLADLEHYVTQLQLANYEGIGPEKLQGYLAGSWYLTALPQALNPFRQSEKTTNLFLMYSPDENQCRFVEKDEQGYPIDRESLLQINRALVSQSHKKNEWLHRDYGHLLEKYADMFDCSMEAISLKYGELNFVYRDQEYQYSDQLGLVGQ